MALISFMASGMIASVSAILAWGVADLSALSALKLYAVIAFGLPLALVSIRMLRFPAHRQVAEQNAQPAYVSEKA